MTWIFLMFALMTAALIIDFILLVKHERRMDMLEAEIANHYVYFSGELEELTEKKPKRDSKRNC